MAKCGDTAKTRGAPGGQSRGRDRSAVARELGLVAETHETFVAEISCLTRKASEPRLPRRASILSAQ
jgi:hypothetical protein